MKDALIIACWPCEKCIPEMRYFREQDELIAKGKCIHDLEKPLIKTTIKTKFTNKYWEAYCAICNKVLTKEVLNG